MRSDRPAWWSEPPSPERGERRTAHVRKQVKRALTGAGVQVGGDHLMPPMVGLVARECELLRERVAGMVFQIIERGDPVSTDDLEHLAYMLQYHYIDEEGNIQVSFPDTSDEAL